MANVRQEQLENAARNRKALEKKSLDVKFELGNNPYDPIENIGIGAYGVVCSAIHRKSKEKVAIKKIPNIFDHPLIAKRTYREIKILKHFKHENVIGIREILKPDNVEERLKDVYIVFDLMESDLHRIIFSKQELTDEHVKYFLYQLLRGLKYVHSANVLHRDLKPGNILINENCDLKIGDFGMARGICTEFFPSKNEMNMTQYVATRWYRAPELIISTTDDYTGAVDLWSVGCIFAEMLGRKQIFPGKDHGHQLKLMIGILGNPSNKYLSKITSEHIRHIICALARTRPVPLRTLYPKATPRAISLLEKMLVIDPTERITVEQALEDVYLSKYHALEDEPICIPALDFSFDRQMRPSELNDEITKEIMGYHKKPPNLVFDFRPVPKEEMLQTVKSPGGNTYSAVAQEGVHAFLQLAGNQQNTTLPSSVRQSVSSKEFQGIGTIAPANKQVAYTGPGTIAHAKPLMGTISPAKPLPGTFTPVRPLQGTFSQAKPLQGTLTPAKTLLGTLTPARPLQGTFTPAKPPIGTFSAVQSPEEPIKKEFKSPLAVKAVNLLTEKSLDSGNDIEMLSARSDRGDTVIKSERDHELVVKTEIKPENDAIDIEMLSARSQDASRDAVTDQSQEKEAENRAPAPPTSLVNLCPPPEEPKPLDAKERLKAMLNQGARRHAQGGIKKKPITAAQRQKEREEARKKRKEKAIENKKSKKKNSPRAPLLTEEDRGMLERWQSMQQVTVRDTTPPKATVFQQPTAITSLNATGSFAIVQNTVPLVQPAPGLVPITGTNTVPRVTNIGQVTQPSRAQGVVMNQVDLTRTLTPPGELTGLSQDRAGAIPGHVPHIHRVSSDSSVGENTGIVVYHESETASVVPRPVMPPKHIPDSTHVPLAVNVTSASNLQTMTLGVTSHAGNVGDTSPDFVDKLLAGGSAGVMNSDKNSQQDSALKPANLADKDWTGEEGRARLPSYTEAVQAKHGYYGDGSPSNQTQNVVEQPFSTYTEPVANFTNSPEQPFQSYVYPPSGYQDDQSQPAASTSPAKLPHAQTASHGHTGDTKDELLTVITKLKQQHVDDLTLAKTPKGTGGGYGLGGEESMDMLSSILKDNCQDEKLDSAPPSASLIRDWMDIVGDMGDINMELLLQPGFTENTSD